ncbi:MAG: DNA polymerase III subunit epsilon [Xanthomarina sp.]|jgi:DNA polymerase-3 subunit epsilon|uniref:3'-5' exonuclease n=1 Tax=Xanthomarina TaxID=1868329 RepID=UPI000C55A2C8|nr:3'-5' exonuclease [Xanthomarina sp.]MBF60465.1 DNA polymerase III subunit epsilon [Xanthomarina sp.]MCB0388125.1 3'-5' exonuclease [Winogradskyella sp.]MDX1317064.1 3'-5' exonuclease [Xanthomarina gelatinilytica]HAI19967.1 DNA polymerase III subunit epsilon [Xanthomarina gelatinilytica]|tara:strand:+ start:77 stop:853 length:777 start_codon:yes stop_codon:yes gene_type:complete
MQLNLTKPICFFDLETTGVNITNDRIVEISILKVYPDGKEERYTRLVNPTIPIPPEVTKVHGISDKDVADKPTFKELAKEIHNLIKDSDLGGFNSNRFDIPLLAEEMLRADIDFDMKNRMSIDVQTIFHKMEQRTLVAAYKFYCDKNLEDAHSAEADTLATYEVLKAQVAKYDELENNTKFLAEFSSRKKFADFAGFLIYNKEGEECFSFGKHKGKRVVDILETEPGYFGWLLNADFPLYTKKVLTSIKLRDLNNKLD